jgi:hypothetical protein
LGTQKIQFSAARAARTPDLQNPHTRVIFITRDYLIENKRMTNEQRICERIPSPPAVRLHLSHQAYKRPIPLNAAIRHLALHQWQNTSAVDDRFGKPTFPSGRVAKQKSLPAGRLKAGQEIIKDQ